MIRIPILRTGILEPFPPVESALRIRTGEKDGEAI